MPPAGRFPRASRVPEPTAPLNEIGVAGFTRVRLAGVAGIAVLAWLAIGFLGQAGETARAAERAQAAKAQHDTLVAQVASLRSEVALVGEPAWIIQQARTFDLQTASETPFVLAPGAAPLPSDAPGSAARRIGTEEHTVAPVDRWLEVLFGASR